MKIPLIQVDAFTDKPFAGNPAAVCLLDQPKTADWMQAVAAEMNLSETAFVWPIDTGYSLRWFTPAVEVDLCGHATIAAAHAMWSEELVSSDAPITFQSRSGALTANQSGQWINLDFPATPPVESVPCQELLESLGIEPTFFGKTKFDSFVVVDSDRTVRQLKPDLRKLADVPTRGVIVTSRSESPDYQFVSRFFAPAAGVDEDPVTGSAHCALAPYWSQVLGQHTMNAYQASTRGGIVRLEHRGDRVTLGGQAITVMRGRLFC